jgi:protein-S-isoprenylcysteine O-methyltransferase Ste14
MILYAQTIVLLSLAALYLERYGKKNSSYDKERKSVGGGLSLFAVIYKPVILLTFIVSVASLWADHPLLLEMHQSDLMRTLGLVLATASSIFFVVAISDLGENYSPCYDLRKPGSVVKEGIYSYVRHPVYASNLLLLAGLAVMTGSIWNLVFFAIVAYFYVSSIKQEEVELVEQDPSYEEYKKSTGMLLPLPLRNREVKEVRLSSSEDSVRRQPHDTSHL